MPNNFKLRGDYYVSKAGSDSNDGLTPDTPKRTVQGALSSIPATGLTKTVVIGAGVYSETISYSTSNKPVIICADGEVVLEGLNYHTITFVVASGGEYPTPVVLRDFTIRNYVSISGTFGFTANNPNFWSFYNMTIENCSIGCFLGGNNSYSGCRLINVNERSSANDDVELESCICINYRGKIENGGVIEFLNNCYICPNSVLRVRTTVSSDNNNIQGILITDAATSLTSGVYRDSSGKYYDLSITTSTGDGTIGNPYGRPLTVNAGFYLDTYKALYPSQNLFSFSLDPKFNDIRKRDFSLQSGSPHIGNGRNGKNIGGTEYNQRVPAYSDAFTGSLASSDNSLFFVGYDYSISASYITGSVTSEPILLSSAAKVIDPVQYIGLYQFNKSTSSYAAYVQNVNVPDFDTYTSASGLPGANPDKLVYYMRITTGSVKPSIDANWDNGGLWTVGEYRPFEWNTKPSIDIFGYTNGDPNFVYSRRSYIKATYIQLKVKLRNDYLL